MRRLPRMHVRVDQAGNHNPAAPVEDIDAGRIAAEIDIRAQLDDLVAVNEQIGIVRIAETIIHRQDGCGLDQGTCHRPLTLSRGIVTGASPVHARAIRSRIALRSSGRGFQ